MSSQIQQSSSSSFQHQSFVFVRQYASTILTIIEDRPKFEFPVFFYKLLSFISFFQVFIYLLSTEESKIIEDSKLNSIARIIQVGSINRILILRSSDSSSILVYIALQGLMLSFFFYVFILTFVKYKMKNTYEEHKAIFIVINQWLNIFFAVFIQVFFTVLVELNCSIMFCGPHSLFIENRGSAAANTTCQISSYFQLLGVIGLVMTALLAWISCYFFRNYEFLEYNLIKRRNSFLFQLSCIVRFGITFFYYMDLSNGEYIKHTISHIYGFICLLDYFVNHPYSDLRVSHFYLKVLSYYYALVITSHLWLFSETLKYGEYLYFIMILGLLFETALQSISLKREDMFMMIESRANYLPAKLDFFLEQFVRLAEESAKDQASMVRLLRIFKSHLQSCQDRDCPCRQIDSNNVSASGGTLRQHESAAKGKKVQQQAETGATRKGAVTTEINNKKEGEIEMSEALAIVDAIFKFFLSQPILTRNQVEFEHLSLKYITFMLKYLQNFTRANYELKLLQFLRSDFSVYFKLIAGVVSEKIRVVISDMNGAVEARRKDEMSVRQIVGVDEITAKFIPRFLKIMERKSNLWSNLQNGYHTLNDFQDDAIRLMNDITRTKKTFLHSMQVLQKSLRTENCIQYVKLNSIFYALVANDNTHAFELEQRVQELRKRDSLKEPDTLTNENLLKESIITIGISISQNIGKITSKKDEKTAHFFGYQKPDFQKIERINDLMPPFLAKEHDAIISAFITKGYSSIIKSSLITFIKSQSGFIHPVKIYLDFSFSHDNDFNVNGTILKLNTSQDFLLFNRSGRILGLTEPFAQYLLTLSTQSGHKLPSGDYVINNLNAFLLFPSIMKRIYKRKEYILNKSKKDNDVILEDRRHSFGLQKNVLMEAKKFQSFLMRIQNSNNNSSQSMGFSKKSKMSSMSFTQSKASMAMMANSQMANIQAAITNQAGKNPNGFALDVFSELSHDIIEQYLSRSSANSQNESENQNAETTANALEGGKSQAKKTKKFAFTRMRTNESNKAEDQLKLRFNYHLSYMNLSKTQNNSDDLYFQLKLSDLGYARANQLKRTTLQKKLATYMLSTTSLAQIAKLLRANTSIMNLQTSQNKARILGVGGEELEDESDSSEQWIFTNADIPQHLLKLAQNESNINNDFDAKKHRRKHQSKRKTEKQQFISDSNQGFHDENQSRLQEKKQSSSSSSSSSSDSDLNDSDDDNNSDGIDGNAITIEEISKQRQVVDQYELAKFEDYNTVCATNGLSEERDYVQIDKFFKVKRIMQFKSATSVFGRALEKAVAEALFELENERNSQIIKGSKADILMLQQQGQLPYVEHSDLATFRDFRGSSIAIVSNEEHVKESIAKINGVVLLGQGSITSGGGGGGGSGNAQNPNVSRLLSNQISTQAFQTSELLDVSNNNNALDISSRMQSQLAADTSMLLVNNAKTPNNYNNGKAVDFDMSARPLITMNGRQGAVELNNIDQEILQTPMAAGEDRKAFSTVQNLVTAKKKLNQQRIGGGGHLGNQKQEGKDLGEALRSSRGANLASHRTPMNSSKQNLMSSSKQLLLNSSKSQMVQSRGPGGLKQSLRRLHDASSAGVAGQLENSRNVDEEDNENVEDDQSGAVHDNIVINILNQKGLNNNSINNGSIHSSTRSSTNSGGTFLKEIIKMHKLPQQSYQYLSLLVIFIVVFIGLNITNLLIIQSDMKAYSNNVITVRQPRNFLRSYGRCLYGFIIEYEIEIGILNDSDGSIGTIKDNYLTLCMTEYFQLIKDYSASMMDYLQQQQDTLDESEQSSQYSVYQNLIPSKQEVNLALMFYYNFNFVIGSQIDQNLQRRQDSYLYLRANYFQFSSDVLSFGIFLVQTVIDTVDKLISKFTIIAIIAIVSVVIVSLISLPIIRLINLYEEKILLIVTRINYDHAQIEKLKLSVCSQLINIEAIDWLKYNYMSIICLKFNSFNANIVNEQNDLSVTMRKQILQDDIMQQKVKKSKSKSKKENPSITMNGSQAKNFVLQSRISNQRLSIIQRFIPLFLLMVGNTIYFLIIIVYLQQVKDQLKSPVYLNLNTVKYHIAQTNIKIAQELLTFNFLIEKQKFPSITSEDINEYANIMNNMLQNSIDSGNDITDTIYGDSVLPSDLLSKLKDLQEGRVCAHLTKFKCEQSVVGTKYGVNYLFQEQRRVLRTYPDVISPLDAEISLLTEYSNSQDHRTVFIESFLAADEVISTQSATVNQSVSSVSGDIQTFLEQYLLVFGNLFAATIIITCILSWRSLYQRTQLMNIMLTFIPEEKLFEEVTLHMLKSLRRM